MTCKNFKRCANYQLGNYACDQKGLDYINNKLQDCKRFIEKQAIETSAIALRNPTSNFSITEELLNFSKKVS
jgi:predicted transcriptional regulator